MSKRAGELKCNSHFKEIDMKVLVIGAGIVGVTTASMLRRRGAEVMVLEAGMAAGMETSFANAGELSFGYSGPWATPGLLKKIPAMLLDHDGPLRFTPDVTSWKNAAWQARWIYWFGLNTKQTRFERNKRRILKLSARSKLARQEHFKIDSETFQHQTLGTLQLFRNAEQFEGVMRNDIQPLQHAGVAFDVASVDQCLQQEPGLEAVKSSIAGGIIFRDDETGDCRAFTQSLAGMESSDGVLFAYGLKVNSLIVDEGGVRGVRTNRGDIPADTVVLCTGPHTRSLTSPVGLQVPIYGVRGYSLTTPVQNERTAVKSTILDERTKVAITRLGNQVRVGGTAAIVGPHLSADPRRHDMLARSLASLFPDAIARNQHRQYWHGARPMTPDGAPIVGPTIVKGLWLNCGHGTLGWTQSFASAEHVSLLMEGKVPVLDPADYALARYGRDFHPARDYFVNNPQTGPVPICV